jgi:hypothetical protein
MKYEERYPSESVFFGTSNITAEDRHFLSMRGSFFDGLKQDSMEILKVLESVNVRLKNMEDKCK